MAVDADANGTPGEEQVHSLEGVFGVHVDARVLFEPGVDAFEGEFDEVLERGGGGVVREFGGEGEDLRGAAGADLEFVLRCDVGAAWVADLRVF